MTRTPIRRLALLSLLLALPAIRAEEPALRDLLRDALYTEEVTRDQEKAAKQYEDLLARHDTQKTFAASALFRLAEVRRKQDRKDDAIKLYQRLLTEFPNAETETKLARENLAALGGKMPEAGVAAEDEETKEIQRLEKLLKTSPDLVTSGDELLVAVDHGRVRVVTWLLEVAKVDVAGSGALLKAAEDGHERITEKLIEIAGDSLKERMAEAMAAAVEEGHLGVVRILLDAGADTNWQLPIDQREPVKMNTGVGTPLMVSIAAGYRAITDLLLAAKADVNMAVTETGFTPVHAAVANANEDTPKLIERLIDLGADVNAVTRNPLKGMAEKFQNTSPLQYAVAYDAWDCAKVLIRRGANLKQPGLFDPFLESGWNDSTIAKVRFLLENGADANQPRLLSQLIASGPDAIPMIKLLLEAGCDPNATDNSKRPPIVGLFDWDFENKHSGNVYLQSNKRSDQAKLLELLIKHGLNPNTTYGESVRSSSFNVSRHSDSNTGGPFMEETKESEPLPKSLLMMVVEMEKNRRVKNVDMIGILLDAGAKPTHEFSEVFDFVAKGDDSLHIAKALLPFRPKTLNLIPTGYFLNWNQEVERLFLDEILNPALAEKGGIHFVLAEQGGSKTLVEEGQPIPDTAELLLGALPSMLTEHPSNPFGYSMDLSHKMRELVLTLVRRGADKTWNREPIDWKGDGPLPKLMAGDVIEFTWGPVTANVGFKDWLTWHLRKRVSFPVTVEIGGKTREIKLRGDLLSYDPTKNEAPLLSAGRLAMLFLPNSWDDGHRVLKQDSMLTVRRKGGADTRMDLSASGALEFNLQAGDHLILPDPESVMEPVDQVFRPVQLVIPGYPGSLLFHLLNNTRVEGKPTLTTPTLVQVLSDAYAGFCFENTGDRDLDARFPEFSSRLQVGNVPVILPHPDFSRIRIKRKNEQGKETVLEIDLNKAIQQCSEDTPAAEAKKADVALLPGDVVELPLKTDLLERAWNGFTKEEERFFQKALSGVVMVRKQDGIIEQVRISYHQPEWKPSPHGLIPLLPKEGVPTARLDALTGTNGGGPKLKRDGQEIHLNSADPLMRDSDEIDAGNRAAIPVVPPGMQPGRPPPRERVVMPPSPTPRPNR